MGPGASGTRHFVKCRSSGPPLTAEAGTLGRGSELCFKMSSRGVQGEGSGSVPAKGQGARGGGAGGSDLPILGTFSTCTSEDKTKIRSE